VRKRIKQINGTIESNFVAGLESAGVKEGICGYWKKGFMRGKLGNEMIIYPNRNKSGFCWNETDADGNFVFNYLKAGII